MSKELPTDIKQKVDKILDSFYFDVQAGSMSGKSKLSEEYIVKLLTKLIMSICTAYWSITELLDYAQSRRSFREFVRNESVPRTPTRKP